MLGKVIVHGPTREAARRALVAALDDTAILGLTTNVGFLRALADSAAFRDCEVHTAWLDAHPDAIRPQGVETAAVLGAWALADAAAEQTGHPFATADGWRLAGPPAPVHVELVVEGRPTVFHFDRSGSVHTDERVWAVHPIESASGRLLLEVDDVVHEAGVRIGPHHVGVAYLGNTHRFDRPDTFGPGATRSASDGTVVAPMPGTLLAVSVRPGQTVAEGDVLGVLEAMKMELALKAPAAGTVAVVDAAVGEQVALGATLFVVEADAGEPAVGTEAPGPVAGAGRRDDAHAAGGR
jgi:acetyl-CoA/propionyl-CoA carboxylase, biotin carboxylase, biotin carboxyl carrier protein